uniref:(northern house mosquito) hypothetical protein n=1 Tax=Culex pipiens TaxID=7175 RepID=A0A8D8FIT1_CULPI
MALCTHRGVLRILIIISCVKIILLMQIQNFMILSVLFSCSTIYYLILGYSKNTLFSLKLKFYVFRFPSSFPPLIIIMNDRKNLFKKNNKLNKCDKISESFTLRTSLLISL